MKNYKKIVVISFFAVVILTYSQAAETDTILLEQINRQLTMLNHNISYIASNLYNMTLDRQSVHWKGKYLRCPNEFEIEVPGMLWGTKKEIRCNCSNIKNGIIDTSED